ncbi:MAG: hypothetical protein JW965_01835 [Bacteroidales bacterium]|nr:hypothetical protein [Bacteroidales bacterium]
MKKIIILFLLLLAAAGLTSCEGLFDDCKICRLNVYENGFLVNTLEEAEYCGAELITIQNTPPQVDGNITTRWECD